MFMHKVIERNFTMKQLYDENSFLFDFEAIVTTCSYDHEKKIYKVSLDQTAFFPEGGGQLSDQGFFNFAFENREESLPVLDVQKEGDIVFHYLPSPLHIGTKIRGKIDEKRRWDFMQQHSGEHIFSGLVHQYFGADNVGFHLGLWEVTLDFNQLLTLEQLRFIELKANQAIWKNIPIESSYPKEEILKTLEYRSKLDLTQNVRIVTIPGYDTCACCAPHLKTTGQIGQIKVIDVSAHRRGVRVTILCGERALKDYTIKQDNIFSISSSLSVPQNEAAQGVERVKEELASCKEANHILETKLLKEKIKVLPSSAETNHVLLFTDLAPEIAIRNVINHLVQEYKGYVGIFWGDDTMGYRYLIGSKHLDCCQINQKLRDLFHAKGGGKSPMVQGSVTAPRKELEALFY